MIRCRDSRMFHLTLLASALSPALYHQMLGRGTAQRCSLPEGLPSAVLFWCLAAQMDWLVPSLILWLPSWTVLSPLLLALYKY